MVYAVEADMFLVEVTPDTFQAGQAVDLKISVMLDDGSIVKDYDGDVFITVNHPDDTQYTVPSEGIYTFVAENQWVKVFSKWLIIKAAWEYKVVVEDVLGEISGSATVVVTAESGGSGTTAWKVTITSPAPGTVVTTSWSLNIIWKSSLPNTPVFINLNETDQDSKMTTNVAGDFNVYAQGLVVGSNVIKIVLKDAAWAVLWTSNAITINLSEEKEEEASTEDLLLSFFVQPAWDIFPGDLITLWAITQESVTKVDVTVWPSNYTLDKVSAWQFGKEITLQHPGTYAVQVTVYVNDVNQKATQNPLKISQGVASPSPIEWSEWSSGLNNGEIPEKPLVGIGLIKHEIDPSDQSSIKITWEAIGDIEYFLVRHGKNSAFLDKELIVVETWVTLTKLESNQTIYVQVWPADKDWKTIGVPSDPLVITMEWPVCVVKGLTLWTEQRWNNYYLVWDKVDDVKEYIIYRSEFQVSLLTQMQEIARTKDTSYHYPFDRTTKNKEYAYFAVEAICEWGGKAAFDDIKKVQVWPVTNMLALIILTILWYGLWRVYYFSRPDLD